ncbi:hypothetical protein C8R45DRAFT_944775 [Mycena sanguinolenta]|nr:hypothetical protein C8R45DRAFT_944775 [Mycena sanguinolenta]
MVHPGHPLDRPQDIRARPFMLCWNITDHRPPAELKNKRVPIFRVKYQCTGHCRHGHTTFQGSNSKSDSNSNSNSNSDSDSDSGWVSDSSSSFEDSAGQGYVEIDEDGGQNEDGTDSDTSSDAMAALNRQLNSGAGRKGKKPRRSKCNVVLHASYFFIYYIRLPNRPVGLTGHLSDIRA